jgi:hypothetical protein
MVEIGRRPGFTETMKAEVAKVLREGLSVRAAAGYVGCDESTIRRAIQRDPEFARTVDRARRDTELELLGNIRNASKKEQCWHAAAWRLERMFPDRYGPRTRDTFTGEQVSQLVDQFMEAIEHEAPQALRVHLIGEEKGPFCFFRNSTA